MSEPEDRGLEELERRLQAAFAGTRPRRGFEDELRTRLWRPRRPGWPAALLPTVGGLAAVLLVGFLLIGTLSQLHPGGAGSTSSRPGAAPAALAPTFGQLPRPGPGVLENAGDRAAGAAEPQSSPAKVAVDVAPPPQPATVRVYAFGRGGSPGAVVDPAAVPSGLPSAEYPARPPEEALQIARSAAAREQASQVTLTGWRLVYVAVPASSGGYYEPAYEFSGTATSGAFSSPVRVLVLAVADSGLR